MKVLVIGDAHLKISIYDDAKAFISQLLTQVKQGKYDAVILLGDQYDTFAIIRSEIQALWTQFFVTASQHTKVIALVGNHDLAGADGGTNPMEPFATYPNVFIVDKYLQWSSSPDSRGDIQFLPFIRSKEEFEDTCRKLPAGSLLFCHQSFNGAQFENGFYDPHGADVSCVRHLRGVISGHVHKAQQVENIWYPGTPFQHNFGDAEETKYIYELELTPTAYTVTRKIQLDMPQFAVLEADTLDDLKKAVTEAQDSLSNLGRWSVKLIARGTPSEIQEFWNDYSVKQLKSEAKRVVDGLTSTKPSQNLPGMKATTQREKLHEFIRSKQWRSAGEELIGRAEELLGT